MAYKKKTKAKNKIMKAKPKSLAIEPPRILVSEQSAFVQETPKETVLEQTTNYGFSEKEKLITQLTASGMVLSFGLSVGSVMIAPAWPQGGGLLATLGIMSCFGAFMARETV